MAPLVFLDSRMISTMLQETPHNLRQHGNSIISALHCFFTFLLFFASSATTPMKLNLRTIFSSIYSNTKRNVATFFHITSSCTERFGFGHCRDHLGWLCTRSHLLHHVVGFRWRSSVHSGWCLGVLVVLL